MNNLIIIGNGFDLAHNLKTSYNDFIRDILSKKYKDPKNYNDLIDELSDWNVDNLLKNPMQNIRSKNIFFMNLLQGMKERNWYDIEKYYFQEMVKSNTYLSIKQHNIDFAVIKKYLQSYLIEEQRNFKILESYEKFFQQIDSESTLILNFNYTEVLKKYSITKSKLINLHGELKSEKNPIIFGFAADEKEIREMLEKDDNEYLRNIKKSKYNLTNNRTDLGSYLESTDEIHVHLFGHSIGLSDKLILNEILTNKNINSIRTYYFQNDESYFQIQSNMERIMNNKQSFNKIVTFPNCHRMPQHNDSVEQVKDFLNYTGGLLEKHKKLLINKSSNYNLPQ